VVDDEESITDLVATALRYEGFQVEVARSGRDALPGGDVRSSAPDRARRDAA
jgi:two-component system OmpR family response regulator